MTDTTRPPAQDTPAPRIEDPAVLAPRLLAALRRWRPDLQSVDPPRRLSGGANQQTWAVDAQSPAGRVPLILRRSGRQGGDARAEAAERHGPVMTLAIEAGLIRAAQAAGLPVPIVAIVLEPDDGLGEGFVMSRVEGETLPRRILRDAEFADARGRLARQCGEILARLHRIPVDGLPPLRRSPARVERAYYLDRHARYEHPRPVLSLAFRWLAEHAPPADLPLALVHGDFRHGNLMIGPDGVRAVLDWELAHLGDPMEDLGWICVNSWRFGNIDLPVGGFGTREQLFEGYAAAGGSVDPARVRYWEVMGSLKWAVMCGDMLDAFRTGADRSVERAAIGRRASEAELDLLRLLAP